MAITLHSITKTAGSSHRVTRVGRGRASGKGKTSGKGHKGQMARAGHKHKPTFEGGQMRLIRRIPKRGFTSVNPKVYAPINVSTLDKFKDGTEVTLEELRKEGLVKGHDVMVKILGNGDLKKKLTVKAHAFSATARTKIEGAGGACEVVK